MVERPRNQLSGTFGDLAGTLDRAYLYIPAGISSTFAGVLGHTSRMQRDTLVTFEEEMSR